MDQSPESRPSSAGASASVRGEAIGLDAVPAGTAATICEMHNGAHPLIARVKAIGLFPGSRVRVLRQGRRIVVSGERTRIALSQAICQHIRVVLEEPRR
ncbi:MAG: FeoA family protein [Planctomycetota bacterium]|jgi:Fe2+ transport system protein FeoA